MPRPETFDPDAPHHQHDDERFCTVESIKRADEESVSVRGTKDFGRYAEILAVCTCGKRKEYFASELHEHVFICNGRVIMRHHKDGLHFWGRNLKRTP